MHRFYCLLLLVTIPVAGFSATIQVPGDYPTIQEAIQATENGDTVVVAPGFYQENLNFLGKAITVKSSFGPILTIVSAAEADSVVRFGSGEGLDSVLEGFTLTNGKSQIGGAGIACENGSSPTIRKNIITGILADGLLATGGGIWCNLGSSPWITDNTIFLNVAVLAGGGIACNVDSNPTISGNSIWGNIVTFSGGGISCAAASPDITNNFIYTNISAGNEGGGAGMYFVGSTAVLTNNTLFGNTCLGAGSKGGGIQCDTLSSVTVRNSILWGNQAEMGKEMYLGGLLFKPTLSIQYSDVEGGKASAFAESGSTLNWGPYMIDADPAIQSAGPVLYNLHLTRLSPCINMGSNTNAPALDIDGDGRPIMGTVDMGADEFKGLHTLESDTFTISESNGGALHLDLHGGKDQGGRFYMIFGSISGTAPGTELPGGQKILPVNWDIFTEIVATVNYPESILFEKFFGTLDGNGDRSAVFNTNGPVPGMLGVVVSFAYPLQGPPWDFVSNPVNVEIVP
jgi:hypothetical protein